MSAASMGPGRLCRRSRPGPSYSRHSDRHEVGIPNRTSLNRVLPLTYGDRTRRPWAARPSVGFFGARRGLARLTRRATAIALITSPAPFVWFYSGLGWSLGWSLATTFLVVIAFRGLIDLMTRRLLPWPSLYGTDDAELKEEDVVTRRRVSFWRAGSGFIFLLVVMTIIWVVRLLIPGGSSSWIGSTTAIYDSIHGFVRGQQLIGLFFSLPFFLLFNSLIFLGPDDADRDHADARLRARRRGLGRPAAGRARPGRGQAGGQPGRDALAVAARHSRRPAVSASAACSSSARRAPARRCSPRRSPPASTVRSCSMPGLGLPADLHRHGRGHRPLARAEGEEARPQVGRPVHRLHRRDRRRRHAPLGARRGGGSTPANQIDDSLFYGPYGALNPSGDMILETRAWRDRLFARAREPAAAEPSRLAGSSTRAAPSPG